MIWHESYKLLRNRKLLFCILGVLILNGLYFWYCSKNDSFSAAGYRKLSASIENHGENEAIEYLNIERQNAMLALMGDEESLHDLTKSYPLYESNLLKEMNLYQALSMEYEDVLGYPEYIQGILSESDRLIALQTLFGEDSREVKKVRKTRESYSVLSGITLKYGRTRGISSALALPSMLFFSAFFAVLFPLLLFTVEKENNTLSLYASMVNGRGRLYIAKLLASLLWIIVANFLLFSSTLLIGCLLYGFPENGLLSEPVQTLAGYRQTALPVSVGAFLILCFLWSLMVSLFLALLTVFLTVIFSSSMAVYTALFLLIGIEGILYLNIDSLDYRSVWKRMNLVAVADAPQCLGQYRSEYLFDNPISLQLLRMIGMLLGIAILFSVTYCMLNGGYGFTLKHFREHSLRNESRTSSHFGHYTSVFWQEFVKFFRINKVGMVLILLTAGVLLFLRPYQQTFTSLEERYYVAYLRKLDKVPAEEYGKSVEAFRLDLEQERVKRGAETSFIQKESALVQVEEYISYLRSKPGTVAVDSRGYELLYKERKMNIILGVVAMVVAIFCGLTCYYPELSTGMDDLIHVSYMGRGRVLARKLFWLFCAMVICFLLLYVRYYCMVTDGYGTPHLLNQANSIRDFRNIPPSWSIRDRIWLIGCKRFIGMLLAAAVALVVVMRTKSFIIAGAFCIGVLVLPLLLCLTGFDFISLWFLNYFFV